jgi:hypothetical protein
MLNNEVQIPTHHLFQNLTGLQFGRLTVLSYAGKAKNNSSLWLCRCICGTIKSIKTQNLKNGKSQSCGCRHKDIVSARFKKSNTTHGLSKTPIYHIWRSMKNRCTNPAVPSYPDYGGRGIKICDRWLNSFENFYEDMGERPSNQHSIDRIDNNGDYEPSNCRWATRTEQNNNKRNIVRLTFNGKEQTLLEWSKELNISLTVLRDRVCRKWTVKQILSTPIGQRKSKL